MNNYRDIIIKPIITEKSMRLMETDNKVTFEVAKGTNKTEVKQAIEEIFNVKVEDVKTMRVEGKTKRVGVHIGKRADYKKAIVKLAEGSSIEFFEGMQ